MKPYYSASVSMRQSSRFVPHITIVIILNRYRLQTYTILNYAPLWLFVVISACSITTFDRCIVVYLQSVFVTNILFEYSKKIYIYTSSSLDVFGINARGHYLPDPSASFFRLTTPSHLALATRLKTSSENLPGKSDRLRTQAVRRFLHGLQFRTS